MRTDLTPTGWVETVVTTHTIKICKALMTVDTWNNCLVTRPELNKGKLNCHRCHIAWADLPGDQNVNLCMMEKEVNRCICDKCKSEIDPKLIIQ